MLVAEELELDVARPRDVLLQIERGVTERGAGLGLRDAEPRPELLLLPGDAHAAPAAAGRRLHDDREVDLAGDLERLVHGIERAVASRHHGQSGGDHGASRLGLVAHAPDHLRRRPDEDEAARGADLGEMRVLGEEAVAGMDRVRPRHLGGRDQARDVVVRLGCRRGADAHGLVRQPHVEAVAIRFAEDCDGRDLELAAGADDAERDLAAVRDEHLAEHGAWVSSGVREAASLRCRRSLRAAAAGSRGRPRRPSATGDPRSRRSP